MADATVLAADVIGYLTATLDGNLDALAVADAALNAHQSQRVWVQFTALMLLVSVADPMSLDELRAFLAMLGLGNQRTAVGL